MPDYLTLALVAAFGLALGSFFNVCIYRVPRRESLVAPGSHCPACGRALRWYENVPLLSYLALGGRCRTCRAPISAVYPLIEFAAAAIAVTWYLSFGPSLLFVSRVVFAFALIVLFVIDLQHRILPNVITLPGIVAGFLFSLVASPDPHAPGWWSSLVGIFLGGGVLWLIAEAYYRVRHEEGLGMGDVKMIAMIGAFLGWKLMLLVLVLSSLFGSLVGLAIIVARRGSMKYALPFGSFLTVGALIASLVGQRIVEWYQLFYQR
jgi:leader peptidase (prepilin peptidase)/N-methyltransferase